MSRTPGRTGGTPPIIYLLGLLVVAGIWWVYEGGAGSERNQLEYWQRENLTVPEMRQKLTSSEEDDICHALVQLGRAAKSGNGDLVSLLDLVPNVLTRGSPRLREYACPAICYLDDDRVTPILEGLLGDTEPRVRLNAAIGLAARGNPAGNRILSKALKDTPHDLKEQRYELLKTLGYTARSQDRPLIEEALHLAKLDGETEMLALCQEILDRIPDHDEKK